MPIDSPRVLVWRERILPVSETFIFNQIHALQRWEASLAGTRYVQPSLTVSDSVALYGSHQPISAAKAQVWRWTGRSRKLDQILKEWQPAVIHAHFGPDATYVLPTSKRHTIPLVATFHGADATSLLRNPRPNVYAHRLKRLFSEAYALHAVSDFIANRLLDLGAPQDKVTRMYIGIPCEGARADKRRDSEQSVLFVGRLVEKKGLRDLFLSMSQLPADLSRTPLHIIGDGPLMKPLRKEAIDRKLNAIFHGAQPPEYVAKLMQQSTIFCAPSRTARNGDSEGLGMVFLEAGLNALPTVSYMHGGVPEVVRNGETGLLASEGDVAALTRHLSYLLLHPQTAAQMGLAARQRIINNFNLTYQISYIEALYDKAARSIHRP